jgi:SAM-dependent methyltransferase
MKIYYDNLSDSDRYLKSQEDVSLEEKEIHFNNILRVIERFKSLDGSREILEIGTGTGWFPLLCQLHGLKCKGLEISPQLIAQAHKMGSNYGIVPDIDLGNIEETEIGRAQYDVIIASSVFEHVQLWREGLRKIALALKPSGLLFFESTNKFSFTSGEYSAFPLYGLYGWLPDRLRYKLRIAAHGPDIMKLGIDFNQFRPSLLRREFELNGFSRILDRIEMADERAASTGFRRLVIRGSRLAYPLKQVALTFADATRFVCIK